MKKGLVCGNSTRGSGNTIPMVCSRSSIRGSRSLPGDTNMRAITPSLMLAGVAALLVQIRHADGKHGLLDDELQTVLARHNFTGRIESTLEPRLGRRIDRQL